MDHKQFDDIIRKKLEGLQPDFDPTHWEQFEEQLDAQDVGQPDIENKVVDATLFDKLHRLEVPYQSKHWDLMADRISIEFHLRGKIIRYKLLELSLMILLLFTFYNTLPVSSSPAASPTMEAGAEAPIAANTSDAETNATAVQGQHEGTTSDLTEKTDILQNTTTTKQSTFTGAAPTPTPSSEASILSQGGTDNDEALVLFNATSATGNTLPTPITQRTVGLLTPASWQVAASLPILNATLPPVSFISPNVATRQATVDTEPPALLLDPDTGLKEKRSIRVGMFASSDYNEIFTASNESAFEDFSRYGLGYGGGISVGFLMGRWEIETGAMYSAKQYAPWILQVQGDFKDGYSGRGLKNTELNLISIPLNVRYDLFRPDAWRIYAIAGVNLHVTFQANYYTGDVSDLYNKNIPVPSSPPGGLSEPSKFDQDNLSRGWFEGGRFDENIYLSGSIGLGVERYLTDEWSIFAQPTYFRSINYFRYGIGPNRDRFNTYSLLLGIKVKM
jgi:hypothetical protein